MAGEADTPSIVTRKATRRLSIGIAGRQDAAVIAARGAAREIARELGFSVVDQTRVATAVSEVARNVAMYAESGTITVAEVRNGSRVGVEVVAEDQGPGIPDVGRVLRGGYSTSGGFGRGISGARALMNEFDLESQPGQGTRVTMRKWRD